MAAAVLLLVLPAALLLWWGGTTILRALSGRRGTTRVLRFLAGGGTLGWAVVAVSPLWSEAQYGVVLLPVVALVGAAVWNGVLLGAAALVDRPTRSS